MKKVRGHFDHYDGLGMHLDLPLLVWQLPRNYKVEIFFYALILICKFTQTHNNVLIANTIF